MNMKKLIRDKMAFILDPEELDNCDNKEELMGLYTLKLREEIEEIGKISWNTQAQCL